MPKQVVGLFDNMQDAQGAVQDLRDSGFSASDISLVASNASGGYATRTGDTAEGSEAAEGAGAGATGGAILGGLAGLLVGLGALTIPGVGPVIAAGTLATTLGTTLAGAGIGAAAGGLVGALVGAGIPEEDANLYAEGIRRGGALVTVQAATDDDAERAADILDRHNVVDIDERGRGYREAGWTHFDENAQPQAAGRTGQADYGAVSGATGTGTDYDTATDQGENAWERSSKVGTGGGAVAGAATGATVGAAGGPVGAAVGGVAGAAAGALAGAGGDVAGEEYAERDRGQRDAGATGASNAGYTTTGAAGTPGNDTAAIGSATDYANSGTTGSTTTGTTGGAATGTGTYGASQETAYETGQGERVIPEIREEVNVGKREVETGGVRVNTEVEERPVNEQVQLRDETVTVDRRPVDRPIDPNAVPAAFQEGDFVVRERDQVADVQKQARVVEEVVINKDVQQRTENVQETARETHVNVEQIPGEERTTTAYGAQTGSTAGTRYEDVSPSSTTGTAGTGYQDVSSAGASGTSGTGFQDVSGAGTTGTGWTGTTGVDTRSTNLTGSTDVSRSGAEDEGAIERGVSKAENAVERGTGVDLNRDGDVGQRDPRNNVDGV